MSWTSPVTWVDRDGELHVIGDVIDWRLNGDTLEVETFEVKTTANATFSASFEIVNPQQKVTTQDGKHLTMPLLPPNLDEDN